MAIEAWPAGLPVPQKTFNCQLRAGLANDQAYIYPQRTRTYSERSSVFSLTLTQTEFETLQTFYQTTLHGGGELFEADWLEDAGFDHHRLRFLKPAYKASLNDGMMWEVRMNLEIISGVPFDNGNVEYWPCEEEEEPPPPPPDELGYIYAGYDGNYAATYVQDCDEFNSVSDVWTSKGDMPLPARYQLAASTIGSAGYVYGGYTTVPLLDCDEYVPDTWTSKTDMPTPARYALAASTIGSAGYVYGGRTLSVSLINCDEYIPDAWTSKTSLPLPTRWKLAASTIGSAGYVYAGAPGYLQDCDEYTPDTWASKTDMPLPARYKLAASTIGSAGYIYGGYTTVPLQDCDEYTPSVNTWSVKTDMLSPARENLAASTIGSAGYIYGGVIITSWSRDCDEYDPALNSWSIKTDIPIPAREELAASTI